MTNPFNELVNTLIEQLPRTFYNLFLSPFYDNIYDTIDMIDITSQMIDIYYLEDLNIQFNQLHSTSYKDRNEKKWTIYNEIQSFNIHPSSIIKSDQLIMIQCHIYEENEIDFIIHSNETIYFNYNIQALHTLMKMKTTHIDNQNSNITFHLILNQIIINHHPHSNSLIHQIELKALVLIIS